MVLIIYSEKTVNVSFCSSQPILQMDMCLTRVLCFFVTKIRSSTEILGICFFQISDVFIIFSFVSVSCYVANFSIVKSVIKNSAAYFELM